MFEWDEAKNQANIAKHGISFEEARLIFDGLVYTVESSRPAERRMKSIGRIEQSILVAVVHTDRDGRTRIISARRATRKERRIYETAIQPPSDS